MTEPAGDRSRAARDAFLEAYRRDLEAGRIRTLAEYQSAFPGDEAGIAEEWAWLEPGSAAGDGHTAGTDEPETIGPYRIAGLLGRGAQATVYLAEHDTLRRRVALKVLHAPLAAPGSTAEQRFRREAELTANLEHPGICSVYETGRSGGLTWIAMQYVPGTTLAAHLAQCDGDSADSTLRLPTGELDSESGSSTSGSGSTARSEVMRVVAFAEQAARALHTAHDHGLVHRDIKPGNLMVTEAGRPVVLDFGLAHTDDGSLGLTRSTDVLGTPYYMAPEQLRPEAFGVDRRTDVYALGVTLYECLTRQRPFDAPSREALFQQILATDPPAPSTLNPQIPRDLEVVLQTALEKDRNRRYQTALDFAEDLRRVRQYEPIRARPISTWGRLVRWAQRQPAVAASVGFAATALVAGLIVSLLLLRDANRALAREQEARLVGYDKLSRAVALDDIHGRFSPVYRTMADDAIAAIDHDAPGFRARIEEIARGWHRTGDSPRKTNFQNADALLGAWDRLGVLARFAAADLLHRWARPLLINSPPDAEDRRSSYRKAADLATNALDELHRQAAEDHGVRLDRSDVRVVRARLLLLDALIAVGDDLSFQEAEKLWKTWKAEDDRAGVPDDPRDTWLYESRLGAVALGLGRPEEARSMLENSVPRVVAEYPGTWYARGASVHLLELYDKHGPESKARDERTKLVKRVLTAHSGRHMGWHFARALFRPDQSKLLEWQETAWTDSLEKMTEDEVEQHLEELDNIREDLGIADDDLLNLCQANTLRNMGNYQANLPGVGWGHPLVGRLIQRSVDVAEAVPDGLGIRSSCLLALASHHLGRNDPQRAEEYARRAEELAVYGDSRDTLSRQLGKSLGGQGKYEEAEPYLLKAFDIVLGAMGPTNANTTSVRFNLARLYREWGRLDDAVRWHRRGIDLQKTAGAYFELAQSYLSFGRLDDARAVVARSLEEHGPQPITLRCRAEIELMAGEFDAAIEDAEAARKDDPAAERILARARRARGDVEEAVTHFESAAKHKGKGWIKGDAFWSDYGTALVESGRPEDARALLERLTDANERHPLAWHARAVFLTSLAKGTNEQTSDDRGIALVCAKKANQLSGGRRAFVLATLAEAYFQNRDEAAARRTADEVLELMNGRDAEWLSLRDMQRQAASYSKK